MIIIAVVEEAESLVCGASLCSASEALGFCPQFLGPNYLTRKARYDAKTVCPIHAHWLDSSTV